MTRRRLPNRRSHQAFLLVRAPLRDGRASSHSQLQIRPAVLTILGKTLNRVGQEFLARMTNILQSLPEARDASLRQAMGAGYAIIALTPIVIAAEGVARRLRLLRDKFEKSSNQKEEAMAPLKNLRQETFCQLVAAGNSATAAYAGAYGRARYATSRVNRQRLLADANIWERIVEIRCQEATASLPTLRRLIEGAEQSAVQQIQTGSFKRQAAERFATMVIALSS